MNCSALQPFVENRKKRAAIADAICQAAGKDIPIIAGLDTALQPVPVYPAPDGASALAHWPHRNFEKADAPAFMYRKIKENPHEIILIGIGNMTNIATMLQKYPDASDLLKGLYVINGYFGAEVLPEPWYNWNSWADPLASKIVFESKIAIHRAIPLEVTDMLTVKTEKARAFGISDNHLMNAVFDFGNAWLESSKKLTLHDPLVAVSVFTRIYAVSKEGTAVLKRTKKTIWVQRHFRQIGMEMLKLLSRWRVNHSIVF